MEAVFQLINTTIAGVPAWQVLVIAIPSGIVVFRYTFFHSKKLREFQSEPYHKNDN